MAVKDRSNSYKNPFFLFLATLVIIFLLELLVMLVLPLLPPLSLWETALFDAALLSLLAVPFLYGLILCPFRRSIQVRTEAEMEHRKIEELDRLKGEFIAVAAHELRNPLTAILGYCQMLLDAEGMDDVRRREFTFTVHQKAQTMHRLIEDMTDLSRLESGHPIRMEKRRNDIVLVLAAIVGEYRGAYPHRTFQLNLPDSPACVLCDRVRIEQVMGNLLNNALKFSPPESPIDIEGGRRKGDFLVRIRDRGVGLSPEQMRRVFDKFYRVDPLNGSRQGLGLGMTISREIIDAHEGTIWLESRPEKGTTVSFILPIAK